MSRKTTSSPKPGQKKYLGKYTFMKFMIDVLMYFLTCGFWAIWIIIREINGRRY